LIGSFSLEPYPMRKIALALALMIATAPLGIRGTPPAVFPKPPEEAPEEPERLPSLSGGGGLNTPAVTSTRAVIPTASTASPVSVRPYAALPFRSNGAAAPAQLSVVPAFLKNPIRPDAGGITRTSTNLPSIVPTLFQRPFSSQAATPFASVPIMLSVNLHATSVTAGGNGNAVKLMPNASISGTTLYSMAVYLSGRLEQPSTEFLSCDWNLNSITQSAPPYDEATGALSFTGAGNPATYAAILQTITYQDNNPTPLGGVRTIRVDVSDGTNAASAVMSINVAGGGGNVPTTTTITAPSITDGSTAYVTVSVAVAGKPTSKIVGGFPSNTLGAFISKSAGSVPTGSVTLSVDGGASFPVGTLNSQGSLMFPLPTSGGPGDYKLFATYIPTGNFLSSSARGDLIVTSRGGLKVPTRTTISAPSIADGAMASVTVTVASLGGFATKSIGGVPSRSIGSVPTGSVALSVDGGTSFSLGVLNSQGVVTTSLPTSGGPGDYQLLATYIPTGNFQGSSAYGNLIVTRRIQAPRSDRFYVARSRDASDNNPGTQDCPWLTIDRVNMAIQNGEIKPGNTIHFRRGDVFPPPTNQPLGIVWIGSSPGPQPTTTICDYANASAPLAPLPCIDAQDGNGIYIQDAGNFEILNLEIKGNYVPGSAAPETFVPANRNGIWFKNTTVFGTLQGISIHGMHIHGFGVDIPGAQISGRGIFIDGGAPQSLPTSRVAFLYGPRSLSSNTGAHVPAYAYGGPALPPPGAERMRPRGGYTGLTIAHCDIYYNAVAGIETSTQIIDLTSNDKTVFTDASITYVDVHDNVPPSNATDPNGSIGEGNGIHLFGVDTGVVEHCRAYNNGTEQPYPSNNGSNDLNGDRGVGIWSQYCNRLLFQYNEAHHNRTFRDADEGGFDFDRWTTNSIMQFNYSHENDGWGYMLGAAGINDQLMPENNVVRFNISMNDSRRSRYGALLFENWSASKVNVYNNTFYIGTNSNRPPDGGMVLAPAIELDALAPDQVSPVINVYNNLFLTGAGVPVVRVDGDYMLHTNRVTFMANDYYSNGPGNTAPFNDPLAVYADPKLGFERYQTLLAGSSPSVSDTDHMAIELTEFFDLNATSTPKTIREGGVNLVAKIGQNWWAPDNFYWNGKLSTTPQDFFGNQLPTRLGGTFSIGASQGK